MLSQSNRGNLKNLMRLSFPLALRPRASHPVVGRFPLTDGRRIEMDYGKARSTVDPIM